MRSRKLIIGSGITAGLAANLLEKSQESDLVWANDAMMSPIPELLPRRVFFDALEARQEEEELAVAEVAPSLQEVVWLEGRKRIHRRLVSTDEFLIYDKSRLANWLRRRAITAGIVPIMLDGCDQTTDFGNYQLVIDCRGYNAVAEDPKYKVTREAQARTACTYAILNRPETVAPNQMLFWSVTNIDGMLQTFFTIPIGDSRISVGCSHRPTVQMDVHMVLASARDFGIPVSVEHISFSGKAVPHIDTVMTVTANIKPIGEAARRSCPLTEYGVMIALSQLLQLSGKQCLPTSSLLRPTHSQIDPHIPLELFL